MKRMPIFLIVLALVLSLAACAKAPSPAPSTEPTAAPSPARTIAPAAEPSPDPTAEPTTEPTAEPAPEPALPPLAEKRDYIMEDTFVISLDGDDFVISSSGLDATKEQVADAYGYDIRGNYPDFTDGPLPPEGGEIRIASSFADAWEALYGEPREGYPLTAAATEYCNSYAGALCQMTLQFDLDLDRLYLIAFTFDRSDDDAETWVELYRKFTESFGEPLAAYDTELFTTPDELRVLLEEGDAEPGVAWGNEAKHIILKADCGNENGRISVITRWAEELLIYGYTVEKALGRD